MTCAPWPDPHAGPTAEIKLGPRKLGCDHYGGGIEATPDDFHALARSSPWRWTTLRFTLSRRPVGQRYDDSVRAWVRRPDLVRVETLDGDLIRVIQEAPDSGVLLTSESQMPAVSPPHPDIHLQFDDDGLVRDRRGFRSRIAYDAPMFNNYHWVALLDPVELADGDDGVGTVVHDVAFVDHHGRQAFQAVLAPTDAYQPRCDCCALLFSELIDRRLADSDMVLDRPTGFIHPEANRVRLDVQTGVCVSIEEIDGSRPGRGHDLRIEAVNEEMPDDLFPIHPSRRGIGG